MKKKIICLCFIALILSFVYCAKSYYFNDTKIKISESSNFSKEEINSAIDCVMNQSGDIKVKKIYYDEERFNNEINTYNEEGMYKENKGNIIILYGDYEIKSFDICRILDTLYSDRAWILIRNDENSDWELFDSGYC